MTIFTGVGTALATPFNGDEKKTVNFGVLERLVEYQIGNGVNALIICGTTGEASTLTDEEQIETIRVAVSAAKGRVPIIAGAGSNFTEHGVELCKMSRAAGAECCLLVTPYYNKTSQHGLIRHYTTIAAAVDLPIILYNVPSRTGLNIAPKTLYELSKIDNIVGVKECVLSQAAQTFALCGDQLDIYTGNDNEILPMLSLGGKGCISVLSNVAPAETARMVKTFMEGDIKAARELQIRYIPLIEALFSDVNPVPVKAALSMMGFDVGGYRMPLCEMLEGERGRLETELRNVGLIGR